MRKNESVLTKLSIFFCQCSCFFRLIVKLSIFAHVAQIIIWAAPYPFAFWPR